jgi:hypothetical protein
LLDTSINAESAMALFYMHIDNSDGYEPDQEGQEFDDRAAAIVEAGRAGGAILTDDLRKGLTDVSIQIFIEDEAHIRVATLTVHGSVGA